MTYIYDKKDGNLNTLVAFGDSPSVDAFGRLRVSNPFTEFDSNFEYDRQDTRWLHSATGTATATHLPNESSVKMVLGTLPGALVRRKTRTRFRYQPGKSLQVFETFCFNGGKIGVSQRVGYMDTQNGIFLELDGETVNLVRRTYTSGSVVNNKVAQASWNIDAMAGAGPSGKTIDWTKTQILILDFEWLGVGRARVGFNIDGVTYYVHQFLNANTLDVVYMTTANLPLTYELENSITASTSTSMIQICSTVVSEGGFNPQGFVRAIANGVTQKAIGTTSLTPIVSIRLKSGYIKSQLWPKSINIYGKTANSYMYWEARVRASVSGAAFSAASTAVEYDVAGTEVIGGDIIAAGYLTPEALTSSAILEEDIPLTANEAGDADILTIHAQAIVATVSAGASVSWREIW